VSIFALADRRITVRRRTAYVLDPIVAASSQAPTRQPARAACVEVRVSGGTANSGTVTISGTLAGSPVVEVLTFAGPAADRRATVAQFDAITTIATTGFTDEATVPTIAASAIGLDGSSVLASYVLVAGWPARMDRGRTGWPTPTHGSTEHESPTFYVQATDVWNPREGDAITDDRTGETYRVEGVPTFHGGGLTYPHHVELRARRDEGRATT
jgi:hypothetical protein